MQRSLRQHQTRRLCRHGHFPGLFFGGSRDVLGQCLEQVDTGNPRVPPHYSVYISWNAHGMAWALGWKRSFEETGLFSYRNRLCPASWRRQVLGVFDLWQWGATDIWRGYSCERHGPHGTLCVQPRFRQRGINSASSRCQTKSHPFAGSPCRFHWRDS